VALALSQLRRKNIVSQAIIYR